MALETAICCCAVGGSWESNKNVLRRLEGGIVVSGGIVLPGEIVVPGGIVVSGRDSGIRQGE